MARKSDCPSKIRESSLASDAKVNINDCSSFAIACIRLDAKRLILASCFRPEFCNCQCILISRYLRFWKILSVPRNSLSINTSFSGFAIGSSVWSVVQLISAESSFRMISIWNG